MTTPFDPVIQVAPSHYGFANYAPRTRWVSYWHQLNEVLSLRPQSALVIGVGDSVVVNVLKAQLGNCVSLDIDPKLQPEIVGSVTNIALPNNAVDVALCSQVLEHLPFDLFASSVRELVRVSRLGVVISLPQLSRAWSIRVGPIRKRDHSMMISLPIRRRLPPNDQHFWEVDAVGYPVRRVRRIFAEQGRIISDFRVPEHPYHHFWTLALS